MKLIHIYLAILSCTLPSCDKARELADGLLKKSAIESEGKAPASSSDSWIVDVSQENFESIRSQKNRVVVIVFSADWCPPCQQLAPILEKIVHKNEGKIVLGKINVDLNKELAGREGVRGIPDVRIYKDGREVSRFTGLPPESEVIRQIQPLATNLPTPTAITAGDPAEPQSAEPVAQPMTKDWLPPGMQRR